MNKHLINVQIIDQDRHTPSIKEFTAWGELALSSYPSDAELTIRVIDYQEMTYLNEAFRHKIGPTNVLSFEHNQACSNPNKPIYLLSLIHI